MFISAQVWYDPRGVDTSRLLAVAMTSRHEKSAINGVPIAMENYGTLRSPTDDDRVNIIAEDELVSFIPCNGKTCFINEQFHFWLLSYSHKE